MLVWFQRNRLEEIKRINHNYSVIWLHMTLAHRLVELKGIRVRRWFGRKKATLMMQLLMITVETLIGKLTQLKRMEKQYHKVWINKPNRHFLGDLDPTSQLPTYLKLTQCTNQMLHSDQPRLPIHFTFILITIQNISNIYINNFSK